MTMAIVHGLEAAAGVLLVWIVLRDLFVAVVVPRPARGAFRPSTLLLRVSWRVYRWFATTLRRRAQEETLGAFGPLVVILQLGAWIVGLILGYGLVLHALSNELTPEPDNVMTSFYIAASLLTGNGLNFSIVGPFARIIALVEATTGLGLVAAVVTLLFSLYGSFQRREVLTITLDALAGAPPSGVVLLETSRRNDVIDRLGDTFDQWQIWSAEVLESHLAYPVLAYFRSSHENESWIGAVGAVLDAAVLILTTVEDVPRGPARLMYGVGGHLVEDLGWSFRFSHRHAVGIERFEFDQACERLAAAGYALADPDIAWPSFSALRSAYAVPLNQMARYWSIPPTLWIGDRSELPQSGITHRHPEH